MTADLAQRRPFHLAVVTANPLRIGGMQTFTRFLVETACAAGWRVTVALSGVDIFDGIEGSLDVQHADWVDANLAGDRRYCLRTILARRRWFREHRPNVALFLQSSNTPFRASVVGAALAGTPVVMTHRTMPWIRDFVPPGRHLLRMLPGLGLHNRRQILKTRIAAAFASRIIYNSEFVRQQYESIYDYPQGKGCVIVNAAPPAGRTIARQPSQDCVVIGYLGRLADEKRIDVLIRALAAMRHRRMARLLLYGEGPLRDSLAKLADELGVADRVEFRPSTSDTAAAYAEMDIVTVCSRRESSSNTVLEAMAAGRTVVVSDAGGLPELIGHGEAGVCVPVGDATALAQTLDHLAEDQDERIRLGQKAQTLARQRHEAGQVGRQWLTLLNEVAAERGCLQRISVDRSKAEPVAIPG
ncbi:MAG: glycosyltransferase family 4 protein [Phycisphaerae bacterium]|nr:glycosyltransferase family 4 protein [Phycisphaerae bacterium]